MRDSNCQALRIAAVIFATLLQPASWAAPPTPATEAQIREAIAAAKERKDFGDADRVVLLDDADVYVRSTGLATTEQCLVTKLLTDAGVRSQCVQRFDFDPATRRVKVSAARIHRADGTIDEVELADSVTQPTVQQAIYWGGEQILLSLPGLRVDDVIELHVSKTGFNIAYLQEGEKQTQATSIGTPAADAGERLQPPMPGHWYEVTLFQARHPIVRKRYSVHLPKDMPIQYEVYNGPLKTSQWFGNDTVIYTFTGEDLPAIKNEAHMEELDDCVPKVVMATVPTWEMKSRWFHEVNERQFEADDAIRQTVEEITEGLTSLDDKVAACNHWVADNIRYYGTSRGPCEGFTLHTGIETFRDRGGVCKDKAGMLVTMLRVLGVETYPALTMAGSRVEDIPADQFNHTVTVMKEPGGDWRILDPTWIPLSREMWSSREALQGLVYGTPDGETLTLSPYYPPSYNRLACTAHSTIDASGALTTEISMDLTGYPDTYLRRNVERHRRPDMAGVFNEFVNIAPTARIEHLEFTDPYDYSHDAVVKIQVSAQGYAARGDDTCLLRLPLMSHPLASWLMPDALYDVSAETREYALHLRATRAIEYSETIQLPEGWTIAEAPKERSVSGPAADLAFQAKSEGGRLSYTFKLELKKHNVPPEDYPKFRESLQMMEEIAGTWVTCRTTSEPVSPGQTIARPATAGGGS